MNKKISSFSESLESRQEKFNHKRPQQKSMVLMFIIAVAITNAIFFMLLDTEASPQDIAPIVEIRPPAKGDSRIALQVLSYVDSAQTPKQVKLVTRKGRVLSTAKIISRVQSALPEMESTSQSIQKFILDVPNQKLRTVLSSHTETIKMVPLGYQPRARKNHEFIY